MSGDETHYMADLSWDNGSSVVYGISLTSGVNVLSQYTTPLSNMYAFDTKNVGKDPMDYRCMELYVVEDI